MFREALNNIAGTVLLMFPENIAGTVLLMFPAAKTIIARHKRTGPVMSVA